MEGFYSSFLLLILHGWKIIIYVLVVGGEAFIWALFLWLDLRKRRSSRGCISFILFLIIGIF